MIEVGDTVRFYDEWGEHEARVVYIDKEGNYLGQTHLIKYKDNEGDIELRLVNKSQIKKF